MMAGKVVGLEFEIISNLDSYFLMTVLTLFEESHLHYSMCFSEARQTPPQTNATPAKRKQQQLQGKIKL